MVFIKNNSPESDIFFNPILFHVFQDPGFLGSRFVWVQVFQGPGFSGSRFFRVQVFQGPDFSGSRFFRVQVFQGLAPGSWSKVQKQPFRITYIYCNILLQFVQHKLAYYRRNLIVKVLKEIIYDLSVQNSVLIDNLCPRS